MPRLVAGILAAMLFSPALALDPADYQLVDLSHAYGEDTLYWPTSTALPMKIEGGSGEPVRAAALVEK